MKLIDKDAVLAEIERRRNMQPVDNCGHQRVWAYNDVIDLLNSFVVKEVNLEKELDSMITPELKFHKALPSLFDIAKHFFELGVNASNPLTWEDVKLIWNIGDEIPYMPEEDFFKELLKRFKAQEGE